MHTALRSACEAFMADDQLFWLLAGMTDVSCETGTNQRYQRAVTTLVHAGFSDLIIDKLLKGVNGNLAAIIESRYPTVAPVAINRQRGTIRPDIWFGERSISSETISEVKALHDWTILQFYGHKGGHGVADDADKLRVIRAEPFQGRLFQAVFFLQLPNYSYCSGKSYGQRHDCRESYLKLHGIQEQYRHLRRHLTQEPAWPEKGPEIVPLGLPDKSTCSCIEQWMRQVFLPDNPSWRFVAAEQLANAAVGCAIWEY